MSTSTRSQWRAPLVAAGVALSVAVVAVAASTLGQARDTTSTAPTIVSSFDVEQPVPLRVFTIYGFDRNIGEVAVIDLETGTSTVYPRRASVLTGLVDGAVMTPGRDLIVWDYPAFEHRQTYLFADGPGGPDLTSTDLEFHPAPDDPNPGAESGLRVVPTPDGEALWVVRSGAAYADIDVATSVELIEAGSGRRLAAYEVEANSGAAGATDAGLVLNTERLFDTGDGWTTEPGSERVTLLAPDGTLTEIGDAVGEVTRPGDGQWVPVGGPIIPSETMALPSISPDGRTLLAAFGQDLDANGTPAHSTLYAIDLRDGSARDIATFENHSPLATWSVDGRWIAVVGDRSSNPDGRDITLYDRTDPTSSFTVAGAIPESHYPFAAG